MSFILQAFANAATPPSDLSLSDWGVEHVKLPYSARTPRFDIESSPWLREILEAIADNENEEIVVCAPTGGGKTTLFEVLLNWIPVEAPGDVLVAMQNQREVEDWNLDRLQISLKANELLKDLWPKDRHAVKKDSIKFPHMKIDLTGANKGGLQSKSKRWVIGDECWLWKQGLMGDARKRTHDRWNGRIIFVSQGADEGHDFHLAYENTDKRRFSWQCEECGDFHYYDFAQVKYKKVIDKNGDLLENETVKTVFLECPACKATYEDKPEVRRRLSTNAKYISTSNKALKGKIGFTFHAMNVWWISWGKLALEWIKAHEAKARGDYEPLKQFRQKREGKHWRDPVLSIKSVLTAANYKKTDFLNGELWDDELHRIMTVDVQRDHFWYVARAWKVDGSSRLITEGKALTVNCLRDLQNRYKIIDNRVFLDSQYEPGRVYTYCTDNNWIALKGEGRKEFVKTNPKTGLRISKPYSDAHQALAPNGKYAIYVFWCNEPIKDILAILKAGQGTAWETPSDISKDYIHQINSEMKMDVKSSSGHIVKRWVKIKKDNHLWDCEAMNLVAAVMVGVYVVTE